MGIHGLKTFLTEKRLLNKLYLNNPNNTPSTTGSPTQVRKIVVDASALSQLIHNLDQYGSLKPISLIYQAQWIDVEYNVKAIVDTFKKLNFELVFIFDGFDEPIKELTLDSRNKKRNDKQTEVLQFIKDGRKPAAYTEPPSGWRYFLKQILLSEEIKADVIQPLFEADVAIIEYCSKNDVWGVLTPDYDFAVLPNVHRLLDISTLNFEEMSVECFTTADFQQRYNLPQEMISLFGSILSSDFSTQEQRDLVEEFIKDNSPDRQHTFFTEDGRRDKKRERSEYIQSVLLWLQARAANKKVKEVIDEIKFIFPDIESVYSKYNSTVNDIQIKDCVIDRLSSIGVTMSDSIVSAIENSVLSTGDVQFLLKESNPTKDLVDPKVFGVQTREFRSRHRRVLRGLFFNQPTYTEKYKQQLSDVNQIIENLKKLASLPSVQNGSRPTWSALEESIQSSIACAQELKEDWDNPVFTRSYDEDDETKSIKNIPVQLKYDDQVVDFDYLKSLNDNNNEKKKLLILTYLSLTGPFIVQDTSTVNLKEVEKKFPLSMPTLLALSMEDVVFVMSVVYLLHNGLNGKLYKWEMDGIVLHYLKLKKQDKSRRMDCRMTDRSASLLCLFQNAACGMISLIRSFSLPNNKIYHILHGVYFNYYQFVTPSPDDLKSEEFRKMRATIASIVVESGCTIRLAENKQGNPILSDWKLPPVCYYFSKTGTCVKENRCLNQHPIGLSRPKTRICKYYPNCNKQNCSFTH
eukprot:TRINITY_DN2767_c1_g2_i4.p1 TRINITY_DN2767_c1_g2~~TRINITY_DN2767_c1_g2_i4.p1  ORF type:complete len:746 (+),score=139.69 TRINITY_DN2767_c1_g2_i4:78-2315(+)